MSGAIGNLILGTGVDLRGLKQGLDEGKQRVWRFKKDAAEPVDMKGLKAEWSNAVDMLGTDSPIWKNEKYLGKALEGIASTDLKKAMAPTRSQMRQMWAEFQNPFGQVDDASRAMWERNSRQVVSTRSIKWVSRGQLDGLGALRSGLGYVAGAALSVGAAFAGMAVKGVTAFMGLDAAMRSTRVLFGESASAINAEVDKLAAAGKSRTTSYEAAAGLGGMLRGSGMGKAQSAAISAEMLEVSAMVAKARGMDMGDVSHALGAGLIGMMRPLHQLGVVITDDDVELEAFRLGLRKSGEELSEQAKVAARASLEVKGLRDTYGGVASTAPALGDKLKQSWGQLDNVMSGLGETLAPATSELFGLLNEGITSLGEYLTENKAVFADWGAGFVEVVKAVISVASPVIETIGASLKWLTGEFHIVRKTMLEVWATGAKLTFQGGLAEELQAKADQDAAAYNKLYAAKAPVSDLATSTDSVTTAAKGAAGAFAYLGKSGAENAKKTAAELMKLGDKLTNLGKSWKESLATEGMSSRLAELAKLRMSFHGKMDANTEKQFTALAGLAGELDRHEAVHGLQQRWSDQMQTSGMSQNMQEVFKLAKAGVGEDELKKATGVARMLDDAAKVREQWDSLAGSAKSLLESTKTPMEKLAEDQANLKKMRGAGLIDEVTYARGMLKAQKDSGLGETKHSGAMAYGSQEARSALIRANDQAARRNDPLQEIAKQSRDAHKIQLQQNEAMQRIYTMLRQFLGTQMPAVAKM